MMLDFTEQTGSGIVIIVWPIPGVGVSWVRPVRVTLLAITRSIFNIFQRFLAR